MLGLAAKNCAFSPSVCICMKKMRNAFGFSCEIVNML